MRKTHVCAKRRVVSGFRILCCCALKVFGARVASSTVASKRVFHPDGSTKSNKDVRAGIRTIATVKTTIHRKRDSNNTTTPTPTLTKHNNHNNDSTSSISSISTSSSTSSSTTNLVEVYNFDVSDTGAGKVRKHRRGEPSRTDYQAGLAQQVPAKGQTISPVLVCWLSSNRAKSPNLSRLCVYMVV